MRSFLTASLAAAAASVLVLAACTEGSSWTLPDVVASGRYVDYGAWADVSNVCMDDRLAAWDRFIEDVAAQVGVAPPVAGIRYSWVPKGARPVASWPCGESASGCAHYRAEGYDALVFDRSVENLHELVHAVEVPMRGRAHRVFIEGMAEYLSKTHSTDAALANFAAEFVAMTGGEEITRAYYLRSMHFVGSLVERDGFDKYYDFRALLDGDAGLSSFVSAYQQVYEADFHDALAEMERTPIRGQGPVWACEADLASLEWSTPEVLDVTLRGECGDREYFSGGLAAGEPEAVRFFTLDVSEAGLHKVTLQAEGGGPTNAVVTMTTCSTVPERAVIKVSYPLGHEILGEGRHQIRVDYPSAAAARAGVRLGLEHLILGDPDTGP